ncbi:MAG: ATP synthase subunit C [Bacillota bacterium]|nr:ATP synthase subunit C [Bacillota bacterium]
MLIKVLLFVSLAVSLLLPITAYVFGLREAGKIKKVTSFGIISFFSIFLTGTVFMFSNAAAETPVAAVAGAISDAGLKFLAAALSTGLSGIGAGVAVAAAASAALSAISENESLMGKALIYVALAEGIALYGFVLSFVILNK